MEWPNNNAKGPATTWDLDVKDGKLTGTQKRGDTVFADLAGVRAPALDRKPPKDWTAPEPIFNGKDLTGWEPTDPAAANHWIVKDGELVNETKGANLKTTRKFDDFKLHIEYNCPDEGNSGIYLRGRYEVQVEYEKVDANDKFHSMGAIYSFARAGGRTAAQARHVGELRHHAGGPPPDDRAQRREDHRQPGDPRPHRRRARFQRRRARSVLHSGRSHRRHEVSQHHDPGAQEIAPFRQNLAGRNVEVFCFQRDVNFSAKIWRKRRSQPRSNLRQARPR